MAMAFTIVTVLAAAQVIMSLDRMGLMAHSIDTVYDDHLPSTCDAGRLASRCSGSGLPRRAT